MWCKVHDLSVRGRLAGGESFICSSWDSLKRRLHRGRSLSSSHIQELPVLKKLCTDRILVRSTLPWSIDFRTRYPQEQLDSRSYRYLGLYPPTENWDLRMPIEHHLFQSQHLLRLVVFSNFFEFPLARDLFWDCKGLQSQFLYRFLRAAFPWIRRKLLPKWWIAWSLLLPVRCSAVYFCKLQQQLLSHWHPEEL